MNAVAIDNCARHDGNFRPPMPIVRRRNGKPPQDHAKIKNGQRPMRAWFHLVARQRSSELFVLNVLLVTLGLGALTESLGLSLALGAFLAGMLIASINLTM